MPETNSPGIYIRETNEGFRPMAGVSTANLGLIGWFERGPDDGTCVFVTSAEEAMRYFGGIKKFTENGNSREYFKAPMALMGYFQNGGTRAYVTRIVPNNAVLATGELESSVWEIEARNKGAWGNRVKVAWSKNAVDVSKWDVIVYYKEYPNSDYVEVERFSELVFNDANSEYYALDVINGSSYYIKLKLVAASPSNPSVEGNVVLEGGSDGTMPSNLSTNDFNVFDSVDEMLIIIAPDYSGDSASDKALIAYVDGGGSTKRTDCFGIITTPKGKTPTEAKNYVVSTLNENSSRVALYYPWVKVIDPITKKPVLFPPVGHIAGVYARTDTVRNVAKVPAGITDGALKGIVGLERQLNKSERDLLYPFWINPLVSESYTGLCVWGARTLSKDPLWRYINVRRAFQYFEKSAFNATHWVVFEPNTAITRTRIRMQLEAFLYAHFLDGYFAGKTPAESYFVICDETNNPPETVEQGLLFVDIGLAIAKPAEFVILRFSQKTLQK